MKRILVLKQGCLGGTDRILEDFKKWSEKNAKYSVDVILGSSLSENGSIIERYEYIVSPTSELCHLWFVKHTSKLIIWSMGHDAVSASFYNKNIGNVIYKIIFKTMHYFFMKSSSIADSIFFTDHVALHYELGIDEGCKEKILPIPINVPKLNSYRKKKKNAIFWLGRVDRDFKVWSLISLLNILKVLDITIDCEFHIIGEGNGLDLVNAELYPFDIINHGNQSYEDMEKILVDQAALLCAMGTSALEGAKLGIPTILINPLYQHEFEEGCPLECRWVYDSKGFSLGEFRLDNINPKQIKSELNILLSEFLSDPIGISTKSYEYVSAYDREDVYNKLLESFLIVPDLKSLKMSLFFSFLSKKIKDIFKR